MAQDPKAPPEELGEGAKAADLVEYQAGSIVSRAILHHKGGTVTAFAFDQGQGLSEHQAPFDALILVLDGQAEVTVGGTAHRVAREEMILLPANIPHAVHAPERFKMVLTMIRSL